MGLSVIGMNPTTEETFFNLTSGIISSAISVALYLGIWYAVDKNTAGIIILLYFANMIEVRLSYQSCYMIGSNGPCLRTVPVLRQTATAFGFLRDCYCNVE